MGKHTRPKGRAAHMHPYRRDGPRGPNDHRDTANRDAGAQSRPGDAQDNAPRAGSSQASASEDDQDLVVLRPQPHLFGQLRILPSATISLEPDFAVGNPREDGPQTDICARVPGRFNTWVARLSCKDTCSDFVQLVISSSGRKSPSLYMHWVSSERTYTFRGYGKKALPIKNRDCNFILWTNESDTETGGHKGETRDIEPPIIPAILGEEGMKMVV